MGACGSACITDETYVETAADLERVTAKSGGDAPSEQRRSRNGRTMVKSIYQPKKRSSSCPARYRTLGPIMRSVQQHLSPFVQIASGPTATTRTRRTRSISINADRIRRPVQQATLVAMAAPTANPGGTKLSIAALLTNYVYLPGHVSLSGTPAPSHRAAVPAGAASPAVGAASPHLGPTSQRSGRSHLQVLVDPAVAHELARASQPLSPSSVSLLPPGASPVLALAGLTGLPLQSLLPQGADGQLQPLTTASGVLYVPVVLSQEDVKELPQLQQQQQQGQGQKGSLTPAHEHKVSFGALSGVSSPSSDDGTVHIAYVPAGLTGRVSSAGTGGAAGSASASGSASAAGSPVAEHKELKGYVSAGGDSSHKAAVAARLAARGPVVPSPRHRKGYSSHAVVAEKSPMLNASGSSGTSKASSTAGSPLVAPPGPQIDPWTLVDGDEPQGSGPGLGLGLGGLPLPPHAAPPPGSDFGLPGTVQGSASS